jgi:hypothetical protein
MAVLGIKFDFNVQHNCHLAKCSATGTQQRVQERVNSDVTEEFIIHKATTRYVINMHSFHNAHLVREALPRSLVAPQPLFEDRQAKHHKLSALLRTSQGDRREQFKAEREAKKSTANAGSTGDGNATTGAGSSRRKTKKRKTAGGTEYDFVAPVTGIV